MKIGILNAINPAESQVDWGGSPVDAYIRFLDAASPAFSYEAYGVAEGHFPPTPTACDAYLITGSPKGVYDDDPWIARLAHFLRDCYTAGVPLVGICFGHQILAHALGGHAAKSEKGWGLGPATFSVDVSKPWMDEAAPASTLYFAHQDQVEALPPGAELLGGNDFCPNAFYVINRRVLSIQGHPEFTPAIMDSILNNREGNVEAARLEAARAALATEQVDGGRFARWIVNFLKNTMAMSGESSPQTGKAAL
jgi:GMP synthase-like glutamine amidotransferase